jgi:CubicO group peptidase (beta-lactamase class C family)
MHDARRSLRLAGGAILALLVGCVSLAAFWWVPRPEAMAPARAILHQSLPDDLAEEAIELVQAHAAAHGLPSVSVAVGVDGTLHWAATTGWEDMEARLAADQGTRYRVGSVAKSFTSAAFGALVDEGRVTFDAHAGPLVPDFPDKGAPITLAQLASHTAGFRHYHGGLDGLAELFHDVRYPDARAGLVLFEQDPLEHDIGSTFSYSTFGTNLLSVALAAADETSVLALLRTRVLEPARMGWTEAEHRPRETATEQIATPYWIRGGHTFRTPRVDNSYKWAGGGYVSTPTDLVRFGHALLADTLTSRASRAHLWTVPTVERRADDDDYALGFSCLDVPWDGVGHSGGSVGGTTMFAMYPSRGIVVAATTNAFGGTTGMRDLTETLATLFVDAGIPRTEPGAPLGGLAGCSAP